MNSLLCCYFPTKVIFVDDNSRFLKSMERVLDEDIASYDFFDNPYEALEFINNSQSVVFLPPSFSIREQKIHEIYKSIYNPRRFEEISTVIVDYEMPSMKGLEFFENLQNPHIRKILYTGVADEGIAVQAFNKGLIDGYISKGNPNQDEIVTNFVRESQLKYFRSLTDVSVDSILKENASENPEETASWDPVFINYFNELIKKHNICEYYLNGFAGGFIFLSSTGKPSVLFTYPEEIFESIQLELQGILEEEVALKKQIPSSLIKDLEENRKTICFPFCGNEMHPDPEDWEKYAYPVRVVQGKQPYYVSYIPGADYINHSEIVSFEKYSRSR